MILLFWCCRELFWFNRKKRFSSKIILYLQNNKNFLVSIFLSKLIFTSIPCSKLDVNSLEFFPSLSQFLELALFEKLHYCQSHPSFKKLQTLPIHSLSLILLWVFEKIFVGLSFSSALALLSLRNLI